MKKLLIYIFVASVGIQTTIAQNKKTISLEEIVTSIEETNTQLKISDLEVSSAKADFSISNGIFLPTVNFSHTAMATTNPLMAFGSKLNQQILTAADFNPILLNNPEQIENFATKIEVLQPLINMDGIFQRKAAQTKLKATALKTERTKQYLTLQAAYIYLQLQLAYEHLEVLKTIQKSVYENQRIAKHFFDQGLLKKTDILAIEIRVSEIDNQILSAENNIQKVSNQLSILTNQNALSIYVPKEKLTLKTTSNAFSFNPNRMDIQAKNEVLQAYKLNHKSNKMSFLPRLNAFGSYELHDDTLFQGSANGYTIGAQLSWTLFEGNQRLGNLKKSKIAYESAKLETHDFTQKAKTELLNAKLNFNETLNLLKTSELALFQAKEIFRIQKNRFREGLEKTSSLLDSEALLAQKKLAYNNAIYQHNYALAYLQFLTK